MNCEEADQFLDAYLDGQLEAGKRLELERHLDTCLDCRTSLEEKRQFRAFFAANAPYYRAPSNLRASVAASLATEKRSNKLIVLARQPWLYAAALLVLSLSLTWKIAFPNQEKPLATQAVSDHARAILLERLCDVVSPDPLVVKSWLTAALGFPAPVVGLPNTAFQMRGGRVDVIQNRKVAAVVYKRDKDLVTLFVWPAAGVLLASRDWSIGGYQACTWNAAHFNFAAVSTLSDRDMDEFIDQIKEQLQ